MLIIDLCGGTGSWSRPYIEAGGYAVLNIDLQNGYDVLDWRSITAMIQPGEVRGILAAPPCTHFASSGAHRWAIKDVLGVTAEAVKVVEACLDCIEYFSPVWWALENPVGRIRKLVPRLGAPVHNFHPFYYGDPWTKATCLWGRFNRPQRAMVLPQTMYAHKVRSYADRSRTPEGFAKAFFEANP